MILDRSDTGRFLNLHGQIELDRQACKQADSQYQSQLDNYNELFDQYGCGNLVKPSEPKYQVLIKNPIDKCDEKANSEALKENERLRSEYENKLKQYNDKARRCSLLEKPVKPNQLTASNFTNFNKKYKKMTADLMYYIQQDMEGKDPRFNNVTSYEDAPSQMDATESESSGFNWNKALGITDEILDTVRRALGYGTTPQVPVQGQYPMPYQKKDNTLLYIIIGVVGLAIIAFVIKGKK